MYRNSSLWCVLLKVPEKAIVGVLKGKKRQHVVTDRHDVDIRGQLTAKIQRYVGDNTPSSVRPTGLVE